MAAMRVMKAAVDQIIDMIPVRDGLVAAIGTVGVRTAALLRSALSWVRFADLYDVLIGMSLVGVQQAPVC